MKSETDVRWWVKSLNLPVVWIEAGRGGTPGAADCCVTFPDGYSLPIELKFWKRSKCDRFFLAKMRREQVRFHSFCARKGNPTLLLWGCSNIPDKLFAVSGEFAPKSVSEKYSHASVREYDISDRKRFVIDIENRAFWRK